MIRARVVTPWTGTGVDDDPFRPLLPDNYPHSYYSDGMVHIEGVQKCIDVTLQPVCELCPDPNAFVVEIEAEQVVIDAIDVDPTFTILWQELIDSEVL